MKEMIPPFDVGPKDIIHHEYTYYLDRPEKNTYYLLNPAERIWHNLMDWIKWRIGK